MHNSDLWGSLAFCIGVAAFWCTLQPQYLGWVMEKQLIVTMEMKMVWSMV